jgi:uncharacterized coiled-coil protein SlyX
MQEKRMKKIRMRSGIPLLAVLILAVFALQSGSAAAAESKTGSTGAPAAAENKSAQKEDSSDSNAVKALQTRISEQQAQIEKLTRAVNLLTQRLNAGPSAPAASAAEPAQPAPAAQVTSLVPVIPASVGSAPAEFGVPAGPAAQPAPQKKQVAVTEGQAKTSTTPELTLSDLAYGKIKIGATVYASFSHFTDAGFSPAFQDTPTIQLAPPGNSGLNAFEVNRAYVNFIYAPDEHVTLRITPDIYRQSDSSYAFRLKYAYFDLQKVFGNGAFKKDKLTFGQTQNPLIDWEEGLSGYRFVYLMPWNYVSLSSTYSGIKVHGPIELNGKEYMDYDFGVFNTASFHSIETNDKKQVMGRVTWYPFGTKADRTGFGLTIFENYGYNTKLPSQVSTPLNRLALLAHYQTHDKGYELVGEYDLGHNAASTGNLFSGTGLPGAGGTYDAFNTAAGAALSGVHTRQEGFAFFGHARLGKSPATAFGLFQRFKPNTNFDPSTISLTDNPLDFQRFVAGVNFEVTKHFTIAVGNENFRWVHPQGLVTGGNTNGIVGWTQFNY